MTQAEALDIMQRTYGAGSFAGICDAASSGEHRCEVGKRESGNLIVHGVGATLEEAIEKAKPVARSRA